MLFLMFAFLPRQKKQMLFSQTLFVKQKLKPPCLNTNIVNVIRFLCKVRINMLYGVKYIVILRARIMAELFTELFDSTRLVTQPMVSGVVIEHSQCPTKC